MIAKGLPLSTLAWICALLPFITTHGSYLIAASYGHVDWCVPYWDSCTSISATGRQMPEKIWFKLGMIPYALMTALLWCRLWLWLQNAASSQRRTSFGMLIAGLLAAFFLILYTLALGEEGDNFQRLRRIGVTLSFAFTFMAQLLFTRLFGQFENKTENSHSGVWHSRLLTLLSCLLAVGITSVLLDALLGEGYDAMEDAFEWIMAFMLTLWFACLALMLDKHTNPVNH